MHTIDINADDEEAYFYRLRDIINSKQCDNAEQYLSELPVLILSALAEHPEKALVFDNLFRAILSISEAITLPSGESKNDLLICLAVTSNQIGLSNLTLDLLNTLLNADSHERELTADQVQLANVLKGAALMAREEYDKAERCLQKALNSVKESGGEQRVMEMNILIQLAQLHHLKKDSEQVKGLHSELAKLVKITGKLHPLSELNVLLQKIAIHRRENNLEQAFSTIEKAKAFVQLNSLQDRQVIDLHLQIVLTHYASGKLDAAYSASKRLIESAIKGGINTRGGLITAHETVNSLDILMHPKAHSSEEMKRAKEHLERML